jgi:hypothetical protein
MTEPLRHSIHHLDWVIGCHFKLKSGEACGAQASTYIERHMPGACRHPALNSDGNLEAFVCPYHLKALEVEAEKAVRRFQPPWWVRWFRDDKPSCPSCNRLLMHAGDVLQCVIELPEGRAS